MVRLCTIFFAVALFSLRSSLASGPEESAFTAAAEAFRDKFYERAEEQFGAFTTNFPASTNLNRAILFQAQARHYQKKHDAAVELLKSSLPVAGPLADEYLLTWGDALAAKGDHSGAAEQYSKLLKDFPNSPLRLQTAYLQALSFHLQKNFDRAIELLSDVQGDFKRLADAAPQDRFSFTGNLLLVDALLAAGKPIEAGRAAAAIPPVLEKPEWQWERFDALARVEMAGTNTQAALTHLDAAVSAAKAAQQPRLQAQSWNLEAELFRKAGQPMNAVSSYEKIASVEALPIDQRRLAVLKSVELLSSTGNITNAIRRLESYLGSATNEPAADLLKVKAGELWIDQARSIAGGNGGGDECVERGKSTSE
jgi:TolA-binding protein